MQNVAQNLMGSGAAQEVIRIFKKKHYDSIDYYASNDAEYCAWEFEKAQSWLSQAIYTDVVCGNFRPTKGLSEAREYCTTDDQFIKVVDEWVDDACYVFDLPKAPNDLALELLARYIVKLEA